MTLRANQTPLVEILKEMQNQGVSVRTDPAINPIVTATFIEKSTDRVFSSILKPYNYSLIWESAESLKEPRLSLVEIQIFQQGRKSAIQPLPKDNNLSLVRGDDGRLFVKGSLLVRLNKTLTKDRLDQILGSIGATVTDSFPELGIVRIRLPESADPQKMAERLSAYDETGVVEPDYAYPLESNQAISTNTVPTEITLGTLPVDAAPVAVLDSGLLQQYAGSPFISGFYDALSNSNETTDPVGHGTQMSLIASGLVHPLGTGTDEKHNNAIVAVRAFDGNGFTSNYTLLRSIDYAIAAEAQVVSMSWGAENTNEMLETVINYATDKGLLVIAAAGNSPTGKPVYPAAYDNVIGVGALMPDGTRWESSNYGDFVSVYAPGIAEMTVGEGSDPTIYAGTSISTAYIANRVAQILNEQPDANRETIILELNNPQ